MGWSPFKTLREINLKREDVATMTQGFIGPIGGLNWCRHYDPPFVLYTITDLGIYRIEYRGRDSGWWAVVRGILGDEGHATEADAVAEAEARWQREAHKELLKYYTTRECEE